VFWVLECKFQLPHYADDQGDMMRFKAMVGILATLVMLLAVKRRRQRVPALESSMRSGVSVAREARNGCGDDNGYLSLGWQHTRTNIPDSLMRMSERSGNIRARERTAQDLHRRPVLVRAADAKASDLRERQPDSTSRVIGFLCRAPRH